MITVAGPGRIARGIVRQRACTVSRKAVRLNLHHGSFFNAFLISPLLRVCVRVCVCVLCVLSARIPLRRIMEELCVTDGCVGDKRVCVSVSVSVSVSGEGVCVYVGDTGTVCVCVYSVDN